MHLEIEDFHLYMRGNTLLSPQSCLWKSLQIYKKMKHMYHNISVRINLSKFQVLVE